MFKIIAQAMDKNIHGLSFPNAFTLEEVTRFGDAFVDDSHFGVTSQHIHNDSLSMAENIAKHEEQCLLDIKILSQAYERLLWSTRGALNILKCSWVFITWRWNHGYATMATIAQSPGSLQLTSGKSQVLQTVPRLEITAGYRTLGCYIAGNGSMRKAKSVLRAHSEHYATNIQEIRFRPDEAYIAYTMFLLPKIKFSLPVSVFTEAECRYIQAPALMQTLPIMRLNRHTARSIIHGPTKLGGLMIQDTYAEQGVGQLRMFLGHLRVGDQTGKIILTAMSYLQLLVGSEVLFLNLPYPKYSKWIGKSWLTSLWQFLHLNKMTVLAAQHYLPKLPREGDTMLTTLFLYFQYKPKQLELLNQCRIYHQVLTTSDIATATGQSIDPTYKR
jgi:hypothetical protein